MISDGCSKHRYEDIRPDGKCRICNREYQRKWFLENKEVQRERSKNVPSKLNKTPKIRKTPMYEMPCAFEGCDRFCQSKGYCASHALQLRESRPLAPISPRRSTNGVCYIDNCRQRIYQVGLCKSHFRKQVRHNRRAASGKATAFQIHQRFQMFGDCCWICGASGGLEIDHVKPINAGGSNWPSNLRPVCDSCNSRKGPKWMGVKGLYALKCWVRGSWRTIY